MKTVWFIRDIAGTQMKLVNLPFVYQLGVEMQELVKMEYKGTGASRFDVMIASIPIQGSIRRLLTEYPALTVSRQPGINLGLAIDEIRSWINKTRTAETPNWDVKDDDADYQFREVINLAKIFETVLKADLLENLTAYHPQQKAIYSTAQLVAHAENALHPQELKKMDKKVVQEIRESGKCLAFDNYTASGFHILRALEVVLHEYYVIVCKPNNPNKPLNSWAAYLTPLYKLCDDKNSTLNHEDKTHIKQVYYLLQQIKNLDRNNIMHPATLLDEVESLKLFDIAKTAIMAMSEKLPDKNQEDERQNEEAGT